MASIITIHLSLTLLQIKDCTRGLRLLSFTDSSSALGWLHHSTFNPVQNPLHDEAARFLATTLISNNCSLYSQHIKGESNHIADSLSRDFHLNDSILIHKLRSAFHSQMPDHFTIYPLPAEITSWIESLGLKSTATKALQEAPATSKLDTLTGGRDFSPNVPLKTPSSLTTTQLKEVRSSVLSRTLSATTNLAQRLKLPYAPQQSMPPSPMWLRPSEKIS